MAPDGTDNTLTIAGADLRQPKSTAGPEAEGGEFLVCAYCGSRELEETVTRAGIVNALTTELGFRTTPLDEPDTLELDYSCDNCGRSLDAETLIREGERARRGESARLSSGE